MDEYRIGREMRRLAAKENYRRDYKRPLTDIERKVIKIMSDRRYRTIYDVQMKLGQADRNTIRSALRHLTFRGDLVGDNVFTENRKERIWRAV